MATGHTSPGKPNYRGLDLEKTSRLRSRLEPAARPCPSLCARLLLSAFACIAHAVVHVFLLRFLAVL